MSTSTTSNDWEYSKENIQPLQQGRKPEVLKHASSEQSEDLLLQQKQAFENELRTYSGDDPLSVWCQYIYWVEQNFLKGGREGHLEELVRKCVTILKDEIKYYNDKRFIVIWLKFANASVKPIEVYNYMYSHNIGSQITNFYIAWSWELEQKGNLKKANQILEEGVNRKTDEHERLKSYFSEFQMRFAKSVMQGEQTDDMESHRSAFTVLKKHKKSAPVERIGDAIIGQNRASLLIGSQQPAPKGNNFPSKVPFKICNDENSKSLPVQSRGTAPFTLYSDSSKENQQKPSKWSKVKVKQLVPVSRSSLSSDIRFNFHCDETPQPTCIPRSVPKVSNVLRPRQESKCPAVALFEPPDPLLRPMYDKNKVYGGGEEFSLEEIKAAAWLKKRQKSGLENASDTLGSYSFASMKNHAFDNQNNNSSLTYVNEKLQIKDDYPRALLSPFNPMKKPVYDRNKVYGGKEEYSLEELRAIRWFGSQEKQEVKILQSSNSSLNYVYKKLQVKDDYPRALLSPFNPMKRPVYNRNKVYGGKEEYSLEELRAIRWFGSHEKQEAKILQQNIDLRKPLEHFQNFPSDVILKEKKCQLSEVSLYSFIKSAQGYQNIENSTQNSTLEAFQVLKSEPQINISQLNTPFSNIKENEAHKKVLLPIEDSKINQMTNISYPEKHASENESLKIKESINKFNFSNSTSLSSELKFLQEQKSRLFENISGEYSTGAAPSVTEILMGKQLNSASFCEAQDLLQQLYNGTFAGLGNAMNEYHQIKKSAPNESIQSKDNESSKSISATEVQEGRNDKIVVPFTFYQDPTDVALSRNIHCSKNCSNFPTHSPTLDKENPIPKIKLADNENCFTNCENVENIPPDNFVQNTDKRELSGILTPAVNVLYIPLEEQELQREESSDSEEAEEVFTGGNAVLSNETLIPPCNTEQFVSAKFFSSTPCTSAKNGKRSNLLVPSASDTYNYEIEPSNAAVAESNENQQAVVDNTVNRQISKSTHQIRPCNLSVIIETSRESYKSSASSGSSASVTKLSQFGYSYDRSNITHNKEYSKADTFKEPKPVDPDYNLLNVKKVIEEISQESDDKKQDTIKLYNFGDDPFDGGLTEKLLQSLPQPLFHHAILEKCDKNFRCLKVNDNVEIKGKTYLIESLIAEGAYGKVFKTERQISPDDVDLDLSCLQFALKVCKHANEWELYICSTLQKRLSYIKDVQGVCDVRLSVMDIVAAKKFNNGILMITELCPRGTLLDLVNHYKKQNTCIPQSLTMYLTLELLQTMAAIHKCKIVHADIKPDNILVRDFSVNLTLQDCLDQKVSFLEFIDFGRSIDLGFFEEGICFTAPLKNRCAEVFGNNPWVFQPDWCGILDCIHTMLFSDYMKIKKLDDGKWGLEKKFPRYWPAEIWSPLFNELLNLPSCYHEPKISEHIFCIKTKLLQNAHGFKTCISGLRSFFK